MNIYDYEVNVGNVHVLVDGEGSPDYVTVEIRDSIGALAGVDLTPREACTLASALLGALWMQIPAHVDDSIS